MGQIQSNGQRAAPPRGPTVPDYGEGFVNAMLVQEDSQWELLRGHCERNDISESALKGIFTRFLHHEEASVRGYRVHLPHIASKFAHDSFLTKELIDLLVPFIYRCEVPDLMEPHSVTDVSFTRFVTISHSFCCEPMSDLIYSFLCACRGNHNLNINTFVYGFNLQQLILLLTQGLEPSFGVLHILHDYCFVGEEDKILVQHVVLLGLKYPLLFFPLYSLVYMRLRKTIGLTKCKLTESRLEFRCDTAKFDVLNSRDDALVETAVTVISDVVHIADRGIRTGALSALPRYVLNIDKPKRVTTITGMIWIQLKDALGYRTARALVQESKLLTCDDMPKFDEIDSTRESNARIHDPCLDIDFVYDVSSDRRAWVDIFRDRVSGEVLRESWSKSSPIYIREN